MTNVRRCFSSPALSGVALMALSLAVVAGPPVSTGPPQYDPHLERVGQSNLGAESGANSEIDLILEDGLAVLGTFISLDVEVGLNVVDIADPANPVRIGSLPQIARVADVKAVRLDPPLGGVSRAAVITNEFPGTLSSTDPSGVKDPAVQILRRGFVVVDLTDPTSPTELFFQETLSVTDDGSAGPRGVHNTFVFKTAGDAPCAAHTSGDEVRVMVYLATETNNFPIYDVTDTIASGMPPTLCSNVALGVPNASSPMVLPGTGPADIDPEDGSIAIHDVVVQEDPGGSRRLLAYLAYFDAGLRIVDVSDPTAPFQVGGENYGPPEEQKQLNHFARPAPDGALTVSCDEIGVGTPGICRVHDTSGLVGASIPPVGTSIVGAPNAPQIGTYTIPQNNAKQNGQNRSFTFTHHNFDIDDRDLLFMGDYSAGVRVADLSPCRGASVADPCEAPLVAKFQLGGGPAVGTEVSEGGLDAAIGFAPTRYWAALADGNTIYTSEFNTGIWILELGER